MNRSKYVLIAMTLLLYVTGYARVLINNEDSCFFSAPEKKLLTRAKKASWMKLEGEYTADSLKVKGAKYIRNFRITSSKIVRKPRLEELKSALLDCSKQSNTVNKCSFVPIYCVKFEDHGHELLVFLSGPDFCGQQVKLVKLSNGKEMSLTFLNESYKSLFTELN